MNKKINITNIIDHLKEFNCNDLNTLAAILTLLKEIGVEIDEKK